MRVSSNMITGQVVFNVQRALAKFLDMETQMSSGKRINKASDDPVGTMRDLDYRAELSQIAQYRTTVSEGINLLETYDSVLADLKDMVTSAKEIAISMANPQADDDGTVRESEANEILDIYERILQLANNEYGGRSIFAGYRTGSDAVVATGNGARYLGDDGVVELQIESDSRMSVNLLGSDVFFKQLTTLGENSDYNIGVVSDTLLADLNGGSGVDLTSGATPGTITITDRNLNITSTIDLATAGATTVQDTIDAINAQLAADGITDITAQIGVTGNNIMFEANPSGQITSDTALSVLRNREGVDMNPATLNISDGSGSNIEVDLSGSTTIGDIVSKFNAAMASNPNPDLANVSMQINAAGTALEITDTNGTPLGLSIVESSSTDTLAADLGILGNINPTLTGEDLSPSISIEIADTSGTTAADLGIAGEYYNTISGTDLDPCLTADSRLADAVNGNGMELGEIVIWQGERMRTIDLSDPSIITVQDFIDAVHATGMDVTASINDAGTGIQIVNNDTTRSFTIEDGDDTETAKGLELYGASDTIGTVKLLENALRNNDEEAIQGLLDDFDAAIENLLTARSSVGAKAKRLEITDSRLSELDLAYTERLSEVEDADLAELVTTLATQENNYQASLAAAAKIIQPSLLNFLD
ncbi:MAG TPA: flagellar hook-associated protein FlgL [candidate division Zixibacteria bacterium]|nr:flagellar hook-associated protein FlgL [candidate division Zixibacteria bacterium]